MLFHHLFYKVLYIQFHLILLKFMLAIKLKPFPLEWYCILEAFLFCAACTVAVLGVLAAGHESILVRIDHVEYLPGVLQTTFIIFDVIWVFRDTTVHVWGHDTTHLAVFKFLLRLCFVKIIKLLLVCLYILHLL